MDNKNDLAAKIIELEKKNTREKVEVLLEGKLKEDPKNIDLWLRLAVLKLYFPFHDEYKSIEYLEEILKIEKDNPIALLLKAYINHYYLWGIDKELFDKLNSIHTSNNELNSMLKYVANLYYYEKKEDPEKEKQLLKESINLYTGHVWNYVCLAYLYFSKGQNLEAKELIKKALKNVKKVYSDDDLEYDLTDPNKFIEQNIKGIYLSRNQLKNIKEMLN